MNTTRACGCKSFRSCFQCEPELGIVSLDPAQEKIEASKDKVQTFCTKCKLIFPGWDILDCGSHPGEGSIFPGIQFFHEFVSAEEEADLIRDLDTLSWDLSQSGRRKQNFGPRANFKKRKTKPGSFAGFPICTKFIQDRFSSVSEYLEDYRTVEQCSIEYKPETGSCIEPHIDDVWVWGERIVQLNLLSDSVLTFFPYLDGDDRYNLSDVKTYPQITDPITGQVRFNPFKQKLAKGEERYPPYRMKPVEDLLDGVVRVPLPRRSLLVLSGEPRYQWEHAILRTDIQTRRIVIAYRELTPPYLPGGEYEDLGQEILEKAELFF